MFSTMNVKRSTYFVMIANAAGILTYLWLASWIWAIPEERGLHSMTAEPFIWFLSALPVLTFFFVADAAWSIHRLWKVRTVKSVAVPLLLVAAWLLAVVVDFSKHPVS